mgnify:CR=1 FL=1
MANNDINRLIDMLCEKIEEAKSPALKPNMRIVDNNEMLDLLDELRAQLPVELKQAQDLMETRDRFIETAKQKAEKMIRQAELLPLTGYIHGGCSPVGMKKQLKTFLDESAQSHPAILVSAGRIGAQVEVEPGALCGLVRGRFAPVAQEAQ